MFDDGEADGEVESGTDIFGLSEADPETLEPSAL